MTAYFIFTREGPIVDQAAMDAYSAGNRAQAAHFVAEYGLKPLAVYGALDTLEGDAPDGVIILAFPDADKARVWHNSDEYQKVIPFRNKAAPYRALLVEGL